MMRRSPPGIYDPGSRFATTPPPPHMVWSQNLRFAAFRMKTLYLQCFFAWWVAGAVRNPANSLDLYNQPSENVLFCNVSASTSWSSAAAPSSISVSHNHIILNLLLRVFSLGTGLLISVYIFCLSNFLLECLVFCNLSNLKFSLFSQLTCSKFMLPTINLFHLTLLVALLFVGDWMTPTPSYRAHPFHRVGGRVTTVQLYPQHITTYLALPSVILFDLAFNI